MSLTQAAWCSCFWNSVSTWSAHLQTDWMAWLIDDLQDWHKTISVCIILFGKAWKTVRLEYISLGRSQEDSSCRQNTRRQPALWKWQCDINPQKVVMWCEVLLLFHIEAIVFNNERIVIIFYFVLFIIKKERGTALTREWLFLKDILLEHNHACVWLIAAHSFCEGHHLCMKAEVRHCLLIGYNRSGTQRIVSLEKASSLLHLQAIITISRRNTT